MQRKRKIIIKELTIIYVVLTIIEMIKYMLVNSNLFGLIYLLVSTLIIFLLIPICINYKKYYSKARISKLFIVIVLGMFSSYLLNIILLKKMSYIDASKTYIESILIIKNYLKPFLYILILVFTINEFKLSKVISKER